MRPVQPQMKFCRRCGTKLKRQSEYHHYMCQNGHHIYANNSPAVSLAIVRGDQEVLVIERSIEPGKGTLDLPGGFCKPGENLHETVWREVEEEIGLQPGDYTEPEFVLSMAEAYPYGNEVVPVLGSGFVARLINDRPLRPDDDAATAQWVPLHAVALDQIYFSSVRATVAHLQNKR